MGQTHPFFERKKMNIERIQALLVKGAALSPYDKDEIRAMVAESGLKINLRSGCPDCWKDAVIQLAIHYGALEKRGAWLTISGNYECLKRGTWVVGGTHYLLDERTPDNIIERFYAINPLWACKYYRRVEKVAKTTQETPPTGDSDTQPKKKTRKKKNKA